MEEIRPKGAPAGAPFGRISSNRLKDLMVRAGQSSERAQLIYQHSTKAHQRKLAADIDAATYADSVRRLPGAGRAARLSPFTSSHPRSRRRRKAHEGSDVEMRPGPDRTTARAEIFAFIETFYNRRRLRKHPAWGYLTPLEIRQRHEQEHALAA